MESHYRCVNVLLVNQANNPDVMVTAYTGHIFPTKLTQPIYYTLMPSIDSDYEFPSLQRVVEVDYLVLTACKKVLGGMEKQRIYSLSFHVLYHNQGLHLMAEAGRSDS